MKRWAVLLGVCCVSVGLAHADQAQLNTTLVQLIQQLETLKPLITQAEREQPANPRWRIHFRAWRDATGKTHAGLRDDVNTIQHALIETVNHQAREPRVVAPITGDFVGADHV